MWFHRSELLAPLTSLTSSKVKFEWYSSHQQVFEKIKKFIGTEIQVLLCYPNFNKPAHFHIYTDASDHQLGAVIMQDKKPIVFYSRKLNTAQKRYTTTERKRELLSATKICKEYKNIIYPATGWFEIVKATNNSAISIQDLFHNTWLARYQQPQFIVFDNGANSYVSSNKCVTIMALKPNRLQVTTINPQANAIMERVHKVVNDMLRSFCLENNHENLGQQEDNPFDYFFQSTAWLPSY
jgi:hypothetical protein